MNGLTLEGSLADLGLNIEQIKAMDYFLNELLRWNRVHNLTAIEDTDSAINLHHRGKQKEGSFLTACAWRLAIKEYERNGNAR